MQFTLLRRSEPDAGRQFAFDTDTCAEVLLGRHPSCQISLNPQTDIIAGIFHAKVQADPKNPSGLIVTDMNSRHGTFVDGMPVRGQAVLTTNSSLVLGRRDGQLGPEFLVKIGEGAWYPAQPVVAEPRPPDVQPPPEPETTLRPPAAVAPSPPPEPPPARSEPPRVSAAQPRPNPPPPRREAEAVVPQEAAMPPEGDSEKWFHKNLPGVPSMKEAAMQGDTPGLPRRVSVTESRFRWSTALIVGGSVVSVLLALICIRQSQVPETWTARLIEQTYGNSVLATELTWKLVDSPSGKEVHFWRPRVPLRPGDRRLAIFQGKDRASVFIRMPDGAIEPVLILGPGTGGNEPVGGTTSGSAVAVHRGGFLLTDLRNATPWTLPYEWPRNAIPGILIDPQTRQVEVIDRVDNWMPLHARAVLSGEPAFETLLAGGLSPAPVVLEGRVDLYRVRLANPATWFQASPNATGVGLQLAVAKIQGSQPLTEIRVPEADPALSLGQRVFILGFAGAPEDPKLKAAEFQVLKAETSSNGTEAFAVLAGTLSNIAQTGSAVFDAKGRLAGLLRVLFRNGQYQGEIVPIRYGRELVRSDADR